MQIYNKNYIIRSSLALLRRFDNTSFALNGTEFPKYYLDRVIPAASMDEDRVQ